MKLGVQAGDVVLDVGCGVGGPAREISAFTDCNVVGLNNNDYQYCPFCDVLTSELLVPLYMLPEVANPTKSHSSKAIS
jgi:hypothetical protein